jgi:hypothetical protein
MAAPLSAPERESIKKRYPDVIVKHNGNIGFAAQELGIHHSALRRMISADPAMQEMRVQALALLEDKLSGGLLRRALNDKDKTGLTASIFYLKAQHGWTDRQEVTHKGTVYSVPQPSQADETQEVEPLALAVVNGGVPLDTPAGGRDEDSIPPESCAPHKSPHDLSKDTPPGVIRMEDSDGD